MRTRATRQDGTYVNRIAVETIQRNNTSGYAGVSWHASVGKWQASIGFMGKTYHLGYFADRDDAALARKEAEASHFVEYLEGLGIKRGQKRPKR